MAGKLLKHRPYLRLKMALCDLKSAQKSRLAALKGGGEADYTERNMRGIVRDTPPFKVIDRQNPKDEITSAAARLIMTKSCCAWARDEILRRLSWFTNGPTVFARNTLAVSHLQGHIVPPCALDILILPYAIMHQVSSWQIGCSSINQSPKWRSTISNPPKNLGLPP